MHVLGDKHSPPVNLRAVRDSTRAGVARDEASVRAATLAATSETTRADCPHQREHAHLFDLEFHRAKSDRAQNGAELWEIIEDTTNWEVAGRFGCAPESLPDQTETSAAVRHLTRAFGKCSRKVTRT